VAWANGDFERAEPLLREPFYALPDNYGVQLADTYIELGRHDRALATVEAGLRRGGKHASLGELRDWLRAYAEWEQTGTSPS
jgi:thioredoxin-like negative regulator of GroEL